MVTTGLMDVSCVRQPTPQVYFYTQKAKDSDWHPQNHGQWGEVRSLKEGFGETTNQTKYPLSFLSFFTDSFLNT